MNAFYGVVKNNTNYNMISYLLKYGKLWRWKVVEVISMVVKAKQSDFLCVGF